MSSSPSDLSELRLNRGSGADASRLPWILVLLTALIVAGMLWVVLSPRGPVVRVVVVEATGEKKPFDESLSANGFVVARSQASVSANRSGRLSYLGVQEGSLVHRGEILARLEDADSRAALEVARAQMARMGAQLEQVRHDWERAESLGAHRAIPESDVEDVRAKMAVAETQLSESKARVRLAAANLENTRVRAPFDGTVLRKDAEVGEAVSPITSGSRFAHSAIVTMADLRTLEASVGVSEADIARISSGQLARIVLHSYPDTPFRGRVRQVVPTSDRQKATVQVKVAILDPDPRILPEMGAKVIFGLGGDGGTPGQVLVPQSAVTKVAGATQVWVLERGRAQLRRVETGPERGGLVEIRNGLLGGEQVLVDPPAGLKEGTRVRATPTRSSG
jgi:HlyD family secretion protein